MAQATERWSRDASVAGLCRRCAAQHGVGRSLGFTRAHAPCQSCASVVALWPGSEHRNGWKHAPRRLCTSSDTRSALPGGTTRASAQRVAQAAA